MNTETERKEDKTMTNPNDARRAHDVLDGLFAGRILSRENEQLLRSFLPELPAQMSLEALRQDVHDVWAGVHGNEWPDDMYCDLETWLAELHAQLKGLKDTPAAVAALPAGMRLADHEEYGRVVVAPIADGDGDRMIFCLDKSSLAGAGRRWAHEDSLTFADGGTFRLSPPEFLETEADYKDAPDGTTVARGSSSPWVKQGTVWENVAFDGKFSKDLASVPRRVLRWGWDR